jgi:sulfite reductase alpha subunit-like flavoprotein
MEAVLVVYVSETGTARHMALDVCEHLRSAGVAADCRAVDVVPLPTLASDRVVLWLAATTGQGAVPRSFRAVWRALLARQLTALRPMQSTRVACLGLGDSSYAHYNVVARRLAARLAQLGAQALLPLHLCDAAAASGSGPQYVQWRSSVLAMLAPHSLQKSVDPCAPSPYTVVVVDLTSGGREDSGADNKLVRVMENTRITDAQHWNDVRQLRLAVTSEPGDILWLWPTNATRKQSVVLPVCLAAAGGVMHRFPTESVEAWMLRKGLQDVVMRVSLADVHPAPWWNGQALPLSAWLTSVFDLWSVAIPYYAVRVAVQYSRHTSDDILARLRGMAAAPFGAAVRDYVLDECRSVAEVFDDFDCNVASIPLPLLLSALPLIQPRPYSVAQCHSDGSSSVLISLKQRLTPNHRLHTGRFSATIMCASPTLLACEVERGQLSCLAAWSERPGVLITAGTGIGGVLSFLLQRPHPRWLLYHGCRNGALDGLQQCLEGAALGGLYLAESRVDGAPFKYVWHALLADAHKIWDLLWGTGAAAFVVVVGSATMARDVDSALATVIKQCSAQVTHEQATEMVRQLQLQGRMLVDVWN